KDGENNRVETFKHGNLDATLCMMGNGYGIHCLAVKPNISCEYDGEVFFEHIAGSTRENNAPYLTPTTMHAYSPVTERDYAMACVTGHDDLITCTGRIGAEVYLF